MPKQTIAYLKGKFQTGMKPSQTDYADVFDSYVHKDDLAELEAMLIDERINNYDAALKEVTAGQIDTLGDVLQVLSGFDTTDNIAALLAAAGGAVTWASVEGKPTGANVTWAEQTISMDAYLPDAPASPEVISSISIVRGIGNLATNKRAVILDISVTQVQVKWEGVSWPSYPVHRIRSIVIGVDPKITLPS